MPEGGPTQETILRDYPRLGLDDGFNFRCGKDLDCFTSCCRDVSIVLTPYDVLRMKRALQLDSTEFLEKYTVLARTVKQKLPVVLLKMNPEDKRCCLVRKEGCSLYAHRPWACRMYPLGLAEPKDPHPSERGFYFVLREELCHGHGKRSQCTVRDWITSQGIESFEMMGGSFTQLMLNEFWQKEEPLTPEKVDMYLMACYDLDRFRRFVFETRFLELFDVEESRREAIRTDDEELLDFAMEWLRFSLFNEKRMRLRPYVLESERRAAGGAGVARVTPR
jgi:Fe-S-cluster containining protein